MIAFNKKRAMTMHKIANSEEKILPFIFKISLEYKRKTK